jgi:hypothetical protein
MPLLLQPANPWKNSAGVSPLLKAIIIIIIIIMTY